MLLDIWDVFKLDRTHPLFIRADCVSVVLEMISMSAIVNCMFVATR